MNPKVSQFITQLQATWKQLGLNQRVSILLATVAVLAGLTGLGLWSSRVDFATLYARLDEAEAGKVMAALDEAKVPYRVSRTGGGVQVPADKVHQVRMQLAAKGIPRSGDLVGFEIFDKSNFGISDFVQRANYLRAVQGELSRTVSQIDLVENARVMIVMPENRLLIDNSKKPTASVFVKIRGNTVLPPHTVSAIQYLVANAVEGLQPNQVNVTDSQGNKLSDHFENEPLTGEALSQFRIQKDMETHLARKVEEMLDKALKPGQAIVRVAVEMNFDRKTMTEEKYDPEGQVMRISTTTDETTQATGNGSGGVPGVAANSTFETNTVASSAPLNTTKKKVINSQYEINKTTMTLNQAAGTVVYISAAVMVAAKTEGTGADRKVIPRTKEELDGLRRTVQLALGIGETAQGVSPRGEVVLTETPFDDPASSELMTELRRQGQQDLWLGMARQALYPALAALVLWLFWRTWRKTPSQPMIAGLDLDDLEEAGAGNGNGSRGGNGHLTSTRSRNGGQTTVTVEVLNQLIRENPDNMTEAIRGWLTRTKAKPGQ